MKRLLSFLLVLALAIGFCACQKGDQATAPTNTAVSAATPEQVAESFLTAMYGQDAQGVVAHFPDYTLDLVMQMAELDPNTADKRQAITDSLTQSFAEEPDKVTAITVETELAEPFLKDSYLQTVQEYYIGSGLVTQEEVDQVEDVVFVAYNAELSYESGRQTSITDFRAMIPCVKVDGQWYVDFYYLTMATPDRSHGSND